MGVSGTPHSRSDLADKQVKSVFGADTYEEKAMPSRAHPPPLFQIALQPQRPRQTPRLLTLKRVFATLSGYEQEFESMPASHTVLFELSLPVTSRLIRPTVVSIGQCESTRV